MVYEYTIRGSVKDVLPVEGKPSGRTIRNRFPLANVNRINAYLAIAIDRPRESLGEPVE
jgi:hypothetical protein